MHIDFKNILNYNGSFTANCASGISLISQSVIKQPCFYSYFKRIIKPAYLEILKQYLGPELFKYELFTSSLFFFILNS